MLRSDLTSGEGVLPPLAYPWLLRQGVSPPLPLHLVSFGLPPTQPLPDVSCYVLTRLNTVLCDRSSAYISR